MVLPAGPGALAPGVSGVTGGPPTAEARARTARAVRPGPPLAGPTGADAGCLVRPPIRTLTVGAGVPPAQPIAASDGGRSRVADCHRRLGLSPTPEHVCCSNTSPLRTVGPVPPAPASRPHAAPPTARARACAVRRGGVPRTSASAARRRPRPPRGRAGGPGGEPGGARGGPPPPRGGRPRPRGGRGGGGARRGPPHPGTRGAPPPGHLTGPRATSSFSPGRHVRETARTRGSQRVASTAASNSSSISGRTVPRRDTSQATTRLTRKPGRIS